LPSRKTEALLAQPAEGFGERGAAHIEVFVSHPFASSSPFVRPRRAGRRAETGLVSGSRIGDASLPSPPTVLAAGVREPFDVVLLGCKAYDLEAAIDAFAPAASTLRGPEGKKLLGRIRPSWEKAQAKAKLLRPRPAAATPLAQLPVHRLGVLGARRCLAGLAGRFRTPSGIR